MLVIGLADQSAGIEEVLGNQFVVIAIKCLSKLKRAQGMSGMTFVHLLRPHRISLVPGFASHQKDLSKLMMQLCLNVGVPLEFGIDLVGQIEHSVDHACVAAEACPLGIPGRIGIGQDLCHELADLLGSLLIDFRLVTFQIRNGGLSPGRARLPHGDTGPHENTD